MTDEIPARFRGMADRSHEIVPALEEAYAEDDGVEIHLTTRRISIHLDHDSRHSTLHVRSPDSGTGLVDWPVDVEMMEISVNSDTTELHLQAVSDEASTDNDRRSEEA